MAFKGPTKFNGKHRPGKHERGRRMEEDETDDENTDYGQNPDHDDDPSSEDRTPTRPFPPARKPEIPPPIQLEKGRTRAGAELDTDDLFAGLQIIITQADTLHRAEEASDTTEKK